MPSSRVCNARPNAGTKPKLEAAIRVHQDVLFSSSSSQAASSFGSTLTRSRPIPRSSSASSSLIDARTRSTLDGGAV